MKTKIPYILFFVFVSLIWCQCDDGYTEYENECYYNEDLNTLTMLISLNDIEFDVFYDIGITLWENGHINTLILEGLSIHEIPNNIQNLDSLVHLSFSDNELENIPAEIGNLPSLEFLFLSNNQLYELPGQIGSLNNLKFLHLPGNQLTELPTSISALSNLQSLNVDNNLITSIPPNIIYLNSLQYLYIANNEIYQLPEDIGFLSELEILSAYTNNISVLPESIGNLSNLYHFDLTNNELIALPETICNIYENLIVFYVGLNDICPPYPSCLDADVLGDQDISSCISTITDIDGNIYQTVQIGDQLWMAENLKVTHYNNGDSITYIPSEEPWGSMDQGQYAIYNDDPINTNIYGNLYNWAVIGDIRGICPEDWHVPSDDEYIVLTDFLGGESVAGGKMKEAGLEHWNYYSDQISLEATNESGFTGLPAGHRNTNTGDYIYMSFSGYFWSSTETSSDLAWRLYLMDYSSGVGQDTFGKPNGFSIRCVSDNYILGDINGDEILNILDIVLMINMILSNEYSIVADVNEDGSVDVLDVVLMVNILVGGLPQSN